MRRILFLIRCVLVLAAQIYVIATFISYMEKAKIESYFDAAEVRQNATEMYGERVYNYTTGDEVLDQSLANLGITWNILYSNGNNVYLIASDCISYDIAPNSVLGNKVTLGMEGHELTSSIEMVITDYIGTSDIATKPSAELIKKYMDYIKSADKESTYMNSKAVAYMLDTNIWKSFAGSTSARYAVGAPTIELLVNSYNEKYGANITVSVVSEQGYSKLQEDVFGNVDDSLYFTRSGDCSFWIASPIHQDIMSGATLYGMTRDKKLIGLMYNNNGCGFRPVVCLNSDVMLQESVNGYNIK